MLTALSFMYILYLIIQIIIYVTNLLTNQQQDFKSLLFMFKEVTTVQTVLQKLSNNLGGSEIEKDRSSIIDNNAFSRFICL